MLKIQVKNLSLIERDVTKQRRSARDPTTRRECRTCRHHSLSLTALWAPQENKTPVRGEQQQPKHIVTMQNRKEGI